MLTHGSNSDKITLAGARARDPKSRTPPGLPLASPLWIPGGAGAMKKRRWQGLYQIFAKHAPGIPTDALQRGLLDAQELQIRLFGILLTAYIRGHKFRAANRWLQKKVEGLFKKYGDDRHKFYDAVCKIKLPDSFTGLHERKRKLEDHTPEELSWEMNDIIEKRQRVEPGSLAELCFAYPDADPEWLDKNKRCKSRTFALRLMGTIYEVDPKTITRELRSISTRQ